MSEGREDQPNPQTSEAEAGNRLSLVNFGKNITDTIDLVKRDYSGAEVKKQIDQLASQTKEYLDKTGVTEKVTKAYGVTQDHLDTVTGVKLLQLVEERMGLQAQYNDILATKLAEALRRIDILEKRIAGAEAK